MMTLRELLEDKVFKEFFTTIPEVQGYMHPGRLPWRVYVQKERGGPWRKKDFRTYREAFLFLKPRLRDVYDATIQSRGTAFPPPAKVVKVVKRLPSGKKVPVRDEKGKQQYRRIVWRPILPEMEEPHRWCPYCRRPTVFGWFSKHHAFPRGFEFDLSLQRCTICGASERLVAHV
jgi:hypothetical protein